MPHPLIRHVEALIKPIIPPHSRVLLGLSGGMDSVVLLHLLWQLATRHHWQLTALHVHHGISANADAWVSFCSEQCRTLAVPLHIEHVDIAPLRALGIEAAARQLRHAAFVAQTCDFVALAHHADDQSETLLLQLLRGAGVRGASAMPVLSQSTSAQAAILRPLLGSTRSDILDYAIAHDLSWIEDESNADVGYPRNFLRHQVLPVLAQKFPAYRHTLARSAQHFAEASGLLDELAEQDADQAISGNTLAVAALQKLSPARAKNLLRYFLHCAGAPMPQSTRLEEMLRQLCHASADAQITIDVGHWQIHRYQGRVYVQPTLPPVNPQIAIPWHGESELFWSPLQQRLVFSQGTSEGICRSKLQLGKISVRLRCGGEALCPHAHAATRTLKNLLQEHHIPPWQRDRLPLLYHADTLVCIVGVAVAAEYQAQAGEPALQLSLLG